MRIREFAWHIILHNIKRRIKLGNEREKQSFIFLVVGIYLILDNTRLGKVLLTDFSLIKN